MLAYSHPIECLYSVQACYCQNLRHAWPIAYTLPILTNQVWQGSTVVSMKNNTDSVLNDIVAVFLPGIATNKLQILKETDTITDWSILPLLIGISEADRSRIMNDKKFNAKHQHHAFVETWLKTNKASWAILVSALRDGLVKEEACANAIAEKHPS